MDEDLTRKEPVEYSFECASLASTWRVLHFHCAQRVNDGYHAQLLLIGDQAHADPAPMMGQRVSVHLAQGPGLLSFGGIVQELQVLTRVHGHPVARLCVVPALALCQENRGARVFQEKSTLQIVQELLSPTLRAYGSELKLGQGERGHKILDFRVQYDESDLAFAKRLLAQAGINFVLRYDHDQEAEHMVLFDSLLSCPPARNNDGGDLFSYHPTPGGLGATQTIQNFALRHRLVSSAVQGAHWDWRLPHGQIHVEKGAHPLVGLSIYDPKQHREDHEGLTQRVKDQMQRQQGAGQEASATSLALGLGVAQSFELDGHPLEELNGRYVLTSLVHEGTCLDLGLSEEDLRAWIAPGPRYHNRLTCVPESSQLLPEDRSDKARIPGPMTALVCGPRPGQVHVDEHGRIQLRFHWDLHTPKGQRGSCWVRVAQGWAGDGFGLNFIPRVGTEVVVEFLHGDPEQPLVTGCVPNRATASPFALPKHKHQSGLRTQSSDGGVGHNELRFDDQRGQEEVYLRAQKALKMDVLGNKAERVNGDEQRSCGGDARMEVLGNRSQVVDGAQIRATKGPELQTFHDSLIQDIGPQGWTCEVQGEMRMQSRGAQSWIADEGFDLTSSKGGAVIDLAKRLKLQASEVEIACGSTRLHINGHGAVSLHAQGQPVSIKGAKIKLNSK